MPGIEEKLNEYVQTESMKSLYFLFFLFSVSAKIVVQSKRGLCASIGPVRTPLTGWRETRESQDVVDFGQLMRNS